MINKNFKGTLYIIIAGLFWGSMGVFVRSLEKYGLTSEHIAACRIIIAAISFSVLTLVKDKSLFKIKAKDIILFIGLGIFSILLFTVCYFKAITLMSMSTSAILLYTSPVWVMIMSALFFKEKITSVKLLALISALAGCVLVSGFGSVTVSGVVYGLLSGFFYALYSIIGTVALRKYSPLTVTTYTFIVSSIGAIVFLSPYKVIDRITESDNEVAVILLIICTGIITAVIPYLFYTTGLKSTEAGKASIIVTVEPCMATVLGLIVYNEKLTVISAIGILLVLLSIIILNIKKTN